MTTKAFDVLQRVQWILQDDTSVRWTAAELAQWLNDGQTAMQVMRPDVTEVITSMVLAPGAFQDLTDSTFNLPEAPAKLMKVSRNMSLDGRRRAVRLVSRDVMDVVKPDWESSPPTTDCTNYMTDPNLPTCFWVYPPAPSPTALIPAMMVEVYYSAKPEVLDLPADDKTWKDIQGDLSVRDRFAMVLVDYVLYRAFMKDSEFGGNGSRAKTHFDLFQGALQADMQGTLVSQPGVRQAAKAE